ncbi:protein kinase domain containing protein [Stylonychia lemnae]|uniref:Casein kinase I n=1 Tax=Stylonychia lemnae TaxID=5949 RepID=A0A078B781_STYLE|nr:protein kinase domain containing protein [Stylonychia lemnae]|eukprot:CDW90051.1 protein kinase domain containing protein [Stylonychia lemnae]
MLTQVKKKPEDELQDMTGQTIAKRYKLKKQAGQGAHGMVYLGKDLQTEMPIAVKLMARDKKHKQKFIREIQIMKDLQKEFTNGKGGVIGFPQLFHNELTRECFAIVMERLGPSLKDIRDQISKKFSLKSVIQIGLQLLKRLKMIHDIGYVHRDLKPANIMIGLGKRENTIYLIDFGLTKKLTQVSMAYMGNNTIARKMAGTPIYSSINAHLATGESMIYVLVQLFKGSLPWQNTRAQNQEDYRELMLQKASIPPCVLCKELPIEFSNILEYILNLEGNMDPDYQLIEFYLKKSAEKNAIKLDMIFDWYDLIDSQKQLDDQGQPNQKNYKQMTSQEQFQYQSAKIIMSEQNEQKTEKLKFTQKLQHNSTNQLSFCSNQQNPGGYSLVGLDPIEGNQTSQILNGVIDEREEFNDETMKDESKQKSRSRKTSANRSKKKQRKNSKSISKKMKGKDKEKEKDKMDESRQNKDSLEDSNKLDNPIIQEQDDNLEQSYEEDKNQRSFQKKDFDAQKLQTTTTNLTGLHNNFEFSPQNANPFSNQVTVHQQNYIIEVIQEEVREEQIFSSHNALELKQSQSSKVGDQIMSQLKQIEFAICDADDAADNAKESSPFNQGDSDTYRDFMENIDNMEECTNQFSLQNLDGGFENDEPKDPNQLQKYQSTLQVKLVPMFNYNSNCLRKSH